MPTHQPTSSGQLLVRPTHLSLNHRDLFSRQALYPGVSFDTPLLSDAVAEIVAAGTNAPASGRVILNPGHGWISDPVAPENAYAILGGTRQNKLGTAQDLLIVDAAETVPCPPHLTGEQAAALPLVGLTGWRALVSKSGATNKVRRVRASRVLIAMCWGSLLSRGLRDT